MTVQAFHPLLTRLRRHASSVLLLGTALLSACSGSTTTGTGTTQPDDALKAKFPYVAGVNYSWTYDPKVPSEALLWKGAVIRAQGGPTDTYLSDMTWTAATSGYGPVELDRSNGQSQGGDGGVLTIGGVAYAKGLGLHANSDVLYTLGGNCSTFSANVGVDGEVGNNGSVVFQLWSGAVGSGAKLYDSGVVRGGNAAKAVSVSLSGVTALHLVVTDAGDGGSYDHADWASAKVTCSTGTPSNDKFVSDLNPTSATNGYGPYEKDRSNGENAASDGHPLTVGGSVFQKGLGVHPASALEYVLGGNCSLFQAQVGVDDEVNGKGSVVFQLWDGTRKFYDSGLLRGGQAPLAVNVPVTGVQTLRLAVTDGDDGGSYDHADWGNAMVTCGSVQVQPTTLSYSDLAPAPYPHWEAQGVNAAGQVYLFGGFDVLRGFTPTDRAYRYTPSQNSWAAISSMPNKGVTHAGTTTDHTSIYFAGGYTADASGNGQIFGTRAVWRYDLATDRYVRLADLPTECAAGALQVLAGKLHYFGGLNLARDQNMTTHYVLDLTNPNSVWTLAAPMPLPRNHMGSVVLGGLIYAIGGQTGTDDGLITRTEVFAYDPAQDAWQSRTSLPFGRSHISGSTFVMGGKIVVAGGETAHTVTTADVSSYDPATDRWTTLIPLPAARSSGIAAALDASHFIYSGGVQGGAYSAGTWLATLGSGQ